MARKKTTKAGAKGRKAELLVAGWLQDQGYYVHLAAATGVVKVGKKTFVKSHDLFGCIDIIAIRREPQSHVHFVQVTTDKGRSKRRRKIERLAGFWPKGTSISIVSHVTEQDPTNKRRKKHFLKFEEFLPGGLAVKEGQLVEIPDEWRHLLAAEFDPKVTEHNRKVRARLEKEARKRDATKSASIAEATPPATMEQPKEEKPEDKPSE